MSVNNLFDSNDKEQLGQKEEENEKENNTTVNKSNKKSSKIKKGETKVKRQRKVLLEKIKKRQKENEKKMKHQQNEIYRLKSIKKEINVEEKEREDKKLIKDLEDKHRELFSTKRLGKLKFEEPELDLKLSDEITGNLRTLKVT
jgi:nucleolar protein 53